MPAAIEQVVRKLRWLSVQGREAALSDRDLLAAFAEQGDEAAFAELVRRHGSLVLGVCRRVLGNVQDAEDAFQATFLVLARKAASVAWQDCIKSWLHSVAYRVALKARGQRLRRRDVEQQASPASASPASAAWDELRAVLDEELQRLPEKYSAPLLLCYLEGKTRDEAAETLGWSVGSVKGRLERGRELLRQRLASRGLSLSAALVTGLLVQTSASASVPAALSLATAQAGVHFLAGASAHSAIAGSVLNLAQGVLHTMMIAKIKLAGTIALLAILGIGVLVGLHQAAIERAEAGPRLHFTAQERKDGERKEGERKEGERKKDAAEGRKNDILGLIKEIDTKVGTLAITHLRENMRGDGVYSLADKNIKVASTAGDKLSLTDLKVGMRVHLELKGDADVIAILVENPQFFGAIGSIDPATRMVELRAERMIRSVKVAPDATLTVAGRAVKLAEVPLNERAQITLSFDRQTILSISVKAAARPGERPAQPRGEGERAPLERQAGNVGTIVDIDAGKGTLKLLAGRPDDPTLQTLSAAKDLKVKVLFLERIVQEVPFAELTRPLQAIVQLSDDKSTLTGLSVRVPQVRGILKSVDPAASKITLLTDSRQEAVFPVAADATIGEPGRAGKLADLRPGETVVLGLSLDRQRVIGIATQPRRGDGER